MSSQIISTISDHPTRYPQGCVLPIPADVLPRKASTVAYALLGQSEILDGLDAPPSDVDMDYLSHTLSLAAWHFQ